MQTGRLEVASEMTAHIPVHEPRHELVRRRRSACDDDRRRRIHRDRAARTMGDCHAETAAEDSRKQQPEDDAVPHVNRVGFQ